MIFSDFLCSSSVQTSYLAAAYSFPLRSVSSSNESVLVKILIVLIMLVDSRNISLLGLLLVLCSSFSGSFLLHHAPSKLVGSASTADFSDRQRSNYGYATKLSKTFCDADGFDDRSDNRPDRRGTKICDEALGGLSDADLLKTLVELDGTYAPIQPGIYKKESKDGDSEIVEVTFDKVKMVLNALGKAKIAQNVNKSSNSSSAWMGDAPGPRLPSNYIFSAAPAGSNLSAEPSFTLHVSFTNASKSTDDSSMVEVINGESFTMCSSGDAHATSSTYKLSTPQETGMLKVPGCVSESFLKLRHFQNKVYVTGSSDARVSGGLVRLASIMYSGTSMEGATRDREWERWGEWKGRMGSGRGGGWKGICGIIAEGEGRSISSASSKGAPKGAKKPTAAVLLSGGVDSSVSLHIMKRTHTVTAFYLKIWLTDDLSHLSSCPWEEDLRLCREICDGAGVALEVISLQDDYHQKVSYHSQSSTPSLITPDPLTETEGALLPTTQLFLRLSSLILQTFVTSRVSLILQVVGYTVEEARKGRTPNPDIMCNSRVKFGVFLDFIQGRNFDSIASGHYARMVGGKLMRGVDPVKDQSYFLCGLSRQQLEKVVFPIGGMTKTEVREIAEQLQLPNRHRPDSQGLCFLGKVKFNEFIGAYLGESPGQILDASTGEVIGRHSGLWFHTVGQRKGMGEALFDESKSKGPWYVVSKEVESNSLLVTNTYEDFDEARREFCVEDIRWILHEPFDDGSVERRLCMKIRHGPRLSHGSLRLSSPTSERGKITLEERDSGLAPGQYVAFYGDDEVCLGCAVISEVQRPSGGGTSMFKYD